MLEHLEIKLQEALRKFMVVLIWNNISGIKLFWNLEDLDQW